MPCKRFTAIFTSSFHNQTCSRMYHGGQAVYDTCLVCITIERCVVYAGQHARRRTLNDWDLMFISCHEYSRESLAAFHALYPFP